MDTDFMFRLAPADPSLTPQLSRTLAQRTELRSRDAYPRLWDLTDHLNSRTASSEPISKGRRNFRLLLSVVDLLLGLFLLIPFAVHPEGLLPSGIVGAAATVTGAAFLWHYNKSLLAGLSLVLGAALSLGAVLEVEELGRLLPVGAPLLALGIAALFLPKRPSTVKFDKAARQLIDARSTLSADTPVTVRFTADGIQYSGETLFPYANLDGVFESKDLFLVELEGKFLLLQKRELVQGTPEGFAAFLKEQMK